ncbi:hypothetical protein GCM10023331_40860 [Algivirga pacifica]|uniref:Uncharacterized protein n=2 Tax=Algivirga pacifica TaxID=1162670 RepID=A0ABP9DN37_9BACT
MYAQAYRTYIFDNWLPTEVTFSNGESIHVTSGRYNIFFRQLEIYDSSYEHNEHIRVVDLNKIKELSFTFNEGGGRFVKKRYINGLYLSYNTVPISGLLEVVSEGPFSYFNKVFLVGRGERLDNGQPVKLKMDNVQYIGNQNGEVQEVADYNENFLTVFGPFKRDIEAYMEQKKVKLNGKNKHKIMEMVDYANKLTKP